MEARFEGDTPVIGGTLAFNDLNLTPIARSIAPYPRNALDFERPLGVDFATAIQMEIRLSASELTLGTVPFQDVAAVISAANGVAKLDVGDATLFGGRAQAAITVDGRASEPRVEGWVNASGIDAAPLMSVLSIRSIALTGTSTIRAKLEAPAENWHAILSGLDVTAHLEANNGAISGFDPSVFAEPGARPLRAGTQDGSIPFSALDAEITLNGTTIDFDRMTLANDGGKLSASGRYFAQTNDIDVAGNFEALTAALASTAPSPAAAPKRIEFTMRGEWPDPAVTTAPSAVE
nr:AsmA-like C-terminal region-containing protein [Jiella mangrovi]